jgi:toxin ParE1/3/4
VSQFEVKFAPEAAQELELAFLWYLERNPVAADRFRSEVFDAIDLIARSPLSWKKIAEPAVRRILVGKYPYSIYFELSDDVVQVLSIAHHRRAPKFDTP